jgi:signal transduction histidine kinase
MHPRSYDVRAELERIVGALAVPGLELRCAEGLEITSDPDHLEQILVNLVINAQKYGEAPYVVEAEMRDAELQLRVCDAGPGVAPAFVPSLFESFTRSPESTELEVEGAGLGLAIVRWLAEESGGRAWYEPNEPTGACFCVTLRDFAASGVHADA